MKVATFYEKISILQTEIVSPKSQYNAFGKYNYRSCEDILAAVKPLLSELKLSLHMSDTIQQIGDRFYVCATAVLTDGKLKSETSALAREPDTKKGMDPSQITGSASSYARKYALAGLLALDSEKDSDSTNRHETTPVQTSLKIEVDEEKDPGDYVITFGKFKGKSLKSIDDQELANWAKFMLNGKTLNGPAKAAMAAIKEYLMDKVSL